MLPGQVYTGRQGEGFATTFNLKSPLVDAQRKQDAAKAKATAQKEAVGKMDEYNPGETWHYYQGEITKRFEDWKRRGAEVMARNKITDIWTSPDPSAIEWQLEGAKIRSAKENINQYQSEYLKAQDDIRTRGKEYTKEYLDAIGNFPNYSFEELASGQINFPQAEFKAPSNYYNGFIKGLTDNMKAKYGERVPTKDEILLDMGDFLSAPENEPFAKSAQQIYRDLTPDAKKQYQALAELNNLPEGWMALSMTQLERQFEKPTYSLSEELDNMAKRFRYKETSKSVEDTSGVTERRSYTVLADKNQPSIEAKSFFAENSTALDDVGFMSALGVDGMDGQFTMTRAERKQAAIKAMTQQLRTRAETKSTYGLSRSGAGGAGDKEVETSRDQWLEDIQSQDMSLANHAAKWLFGTKGEAGRGDVVSARILQGGSDMRLPFYDTKADRLLLVTYQNEKEASAAMDKYFRAQGFDEAKIKEIKDYYKKSAAPETIYYPVSKESLQILSNIHDKTAKATGGLYERKMVPDAGGYFQTKKVEAPPFER